VGLTDVENRAGGKVPGLEACRNGIGQAPGPPKPSFHEPQAAHRKKIGSGGRPEDEFNQLRAQAGATGARKATVQEQTWTNRGRTRV